MIAHKVFAGLGEILWDVLPTGKKLGGAPANFAYHAKMLMQDDATSYVVSNVGDDAHGREIREKLRFLHLNTDHLHVDATRPTGTVNVTFDTDGVAQYDFKQDVAWDAIPSLCHNFANTVDAVCFGTLAQRSPKTRDAIKHFLKITKPGCLKIYDVNLRQDYYSLEIVNNSLKIANVLKINDEELPVIGQMLGLKGSQESMLSAIVQGYGMRVAILTRGDRGSILMTPKATSEHAGHPTKLVDAIGAGDSFTASVAVGLLQGMELEAINDAANRVASFVCTQHGATPHLPEELRRLFTSVNVEGARSRSYA